MFVEWELCHVDGVHHIFGSVALRQVHVARVDCFAGNAALEPCERPVTFLALSLARHVAAAQVVLQGAMKRGQEMSKGIICGWSISNTFVDMGKVERVVQAQVD